MTVENGVLSEMIGRERTKTSLVYHWYFDVRMFFTKTFLVYHWYSDVRMAFTKMSLVYHWYFDEFIYFLLLSDCCLVIGIMHCCKLPPKWNCDSKV